MKFIILDVETANYEPTSICQLGIVVLEDFKIIKKFDYIIKPYPNQFVDEFSNMHGITKSMVEDAPTFDIVWEDIKDLFDAFTPCVAHNAAFDFGHIKATLEHYNCDTNNINFPILCTMQYAQRSELSCEKYNLSCLCNYFNIDNIHTHSALSDALATAELFIKLIKHNNDDLGTLIWRAYKCSFVDCAVSQPPKRAYHKNIKQKDIIATNTVFDENHVLYGKTVVITGQLDAMSRSDAYLRIKNVGGFCGDNITKKTNYLVTNSTDMTSKMKKALQYKEQGQDISIITEQQLYELLG